MVEIDIQSVATGNTTLLGLLNKNIQLTSNDEGEVVYKEQQHKDNLKISILGGVHYFKAEYHKGKLEIIIDRDVRLSSPANAFAKSFLEDNLTTLVALDSYTGKILYLYRGLALDTYTQELLPNELMKEHIVLTSDSTGKQGPRDNVYSLMGMKTFI